MSGGQLHVLTSWLSSGEQPHAPMAQLSGKSSALRQQRAVLSVPPVCVHSDPPVSPVPSVAPLLLVVWPSELLLVVWPSVLLLVWPSVLLPVVWPPEPLPVVCPPCRCWSVARRCCSRGRCCCRRRFQRWYRCRRRTRPPRTFQSRKRVPRKRTSASHHPPSVSCTPRVIRHGTYRARRPRRTRYSSASCLSKHRATRRSMVEPIWSALIRRAPQF